MGTDVLTKKSYTPTPEIEEKVEKLTEAERQRIEWALKEEALGLVVSNEEIMREARELLCQRKRK
ncbi:hypothetical protein [Capnocytophaga sp. oral taxon 336]|uniref:hypothetical protein n=1 Tax=Capnocytophaga sp. oral taxon 336 TaxID=712216 RepID=UPI00034E9604|nr:hypothetical protein [Capnocytophaga sp. oral taxon 336]EPE01420.1 hypothetical protein HMPREF1528_00251 [Capnocytophaga sp. oral taxon 336 str. F0502]